MLVELDGSVTGTIASFPDITAAERLHPDKVRAAANKSGAYTFFIFITSLYMPLGRRILRPKIF